MRVLAVSQGALQAEVRFIGVDDTIEIWNRQAAEALSAEPESLADSLEQMMRPLG